MKYHSPKQEAAFKANQERIKAHWKGQKKIADAKMKPFPKKMGLIESLMQGK